MSLGRVLMLLIGLAIVAFAVKTELAGTATGNPNSPTQAHPTTKAHCRCPSSHTTGSITTPRPCAATMHHGIALAAAAPCRQKKGRNASTLSRPNMAP